MTINGTDHAGDGVTQQAKLDLTTAYGTAASQTADVTVVADLGGQILSPGVYYQGVDMNLTGALTLDAGGDPAAVWVFSTDAQLVVASDASVVLTNGAQVCNIFWRVGSTATIGTNAVFRGTIMAEASINLATSAVIYGRALAMSGTVTLQSNTISRVPCATAGAGGIGTGDGSTSQAVGDSTVFLLAAVAVAIGMGATGVLVTRRRRDGSL